MTTQNQAQPTKRAIDNDPRIVIAYEKHGDRYFYASNQLEENRIALSLLRERYEEGHFYPSEEEIERTAAHSRDKLYSTYRLSARLTDEQVDALPGPLSQAMRDQKDAFEVDLENVENRRKRSHEFRENLENLLSLSEDEAIHLRKTLYHGGPGMFMSMSLLHSRGDCEYERFSVVYPENR